jgi:hypothetical protein
MRPPRSRHVLGDGSVTAADLGASVARDALMPKQQLDRMARNAQRDLLPRRSEYQRDLIQKAEPHGCGCRENLPIDREIPIRNTPVGQIDWLA